MSGPRSRDDVLGEIRRLKQELAAFDDRAEEAKPEDGITRRAALTLWVAPVLSVPLARTAAFASISRAGRGTTSVPAGTTGAPVDTTMIVVETTGAPPDTTMMPTDTTAAPPPDTTMMPIDTTAAPPPDTTTLPGETPFFADGFESGDTTQWGGGRRGSSTRRDRGRSLDGSVDGNLWTSWDD